MQLQCEEQFLGNLPMQKLCRKLSHPLNPASEHRALDITSHAIWVTKLPKGKALLRTFKVVPESLLLLSSHYTFFPRMSCKSSVHPERRRRKTNQNKEKRLTFISCISFSRALLQAVHKATKIYPLTFTPSNILKFW